MRRLLRLDVPSPVKAVERQLDPRTRLALGANPDGSLSALLDDCADAAADALAPDAGVDPRPSSTRVRDRVADGARVDDRSTSSAASTKVLAAAHEVQLALPAQPPPAQADAIADIRAQLDRLLPARLRHRHRAARISRTSRATSLRSAGASSGCRTASRPTANGCSACRPFRTPTTNWCTRCRPHGEAAEDVRDIAWQIEELRVSLWAQQLGTPRPVSEQRIYRAIDAVFDR